jgi:hypothetical protein
MRECRHMFNDIDPQLEEAARTKQRLDAERWRDELRPGAMRLFAARTAKLPWSRGLLNALVEELYPDDLFTELVGNLDRVPRRQWPHVLAIAVALRHSWRRDGLARIARRLHISLATNPSHDRSHGHHSRPSQPDSPARLGPVKALRYASPPPRGAGGLDRALGRARGRLLRDGRAALNPVHERRK